MTIQRLSTKAGLFILNKMQDAFIAHSGKLTTLICRRFPYMHWWEFQALFAWDFQSIQKSSSVLCTGSIDPRSIKDKDERKRIEKIQRAIELKKSRRKMTDYEIGDMFA